MPPARSNGSSSSSNGETTKDKKKKTLGFSTDVECQYYEKNEVSSNHKKTGSKTNKSKQREKKQPEEDDTSSSSDQAQRPEWYEDLSDNQISMFRGVFELLDRDGGGLIDINELYTVMKELDINVSIDEIETIVKELDNDGNGEIDFDEFLYAMSQSERYMTMEDDKSDAEAQGYNRRQRLFFTAITSFAIRNSVGDVGRFYAQRLRHAPHVISFYTAGVRLIGLNERQLERQLRKMQKAAKNQDSPYAKPLPFVTIKKKKKKKEKVKASPSALGSKAGDCKSSPAKAAKKPALSTPLTSFVDTPPGPSVKAPTIHSDEVLEKINRPPQYETTKQETFVRSRSMSLSHRETLTLKEERDAASRAQPGNRRRSAILPESSELDDLMTMLKLMADRGSVVAKLPQVHLLPEVRKKLENGDPDPICSSVRKRRRQQAPEQNPTKSETKSGKTNTVLKSKPRGWVIPHVERGTIPMPVISLAGAGQFTVEDLPDIRKTVSGALENYYHHLKKTHVRTAWHHWDTLDVSHIRSDRLRENFRKSYCAYSPAKEEDVFVIAPWMPGPRYTSRQAGKPMTPFSMYCPPSRPATSLGVTSPPGRSITQSPSRPNSVNR